MSFDGFTKETFRFLFEIGLNNNVEWFDQNRNRYKQYVQQPMKQLAIELMPTAHLIDPGFNPNLNTTVSRIRRDTRYTKDKSPYRNHMWIGFRRPDTRISEGFTLWFEITTKGYDYGAGFYSCDTEFMSNYRKKLLNDPAGFLALAAGLEKEGFIYSCESYKREHFPDAPAEIRPYINIKNFAWCKNFDGVSDLLAPSDILERLKKDFLILKPMYDYVSAIEINKQST